MLMSWARIGVARQSRIILGIKKRSMGGMGGMGSGLSVGFFGGAFVRYKLPIYSKAV